MVTITYPILHSVAPQCLLAMGLVEPLNKYLPLYGINTLLRMSLFLGQAAEESDGFKTLTEYASGAAYEGREDLGNIHTGDGVKFKGRGIFQLTGRANYAKMGITLNTDLLNNPDLAATPDIAVRVACEYWKSHNLNVYADKNDIQNITRRINGGLNGLSSREIYTTRAKNILTPLFLHPIVNPIDTSTPVNVVANSTPVVPVTVVTPVASTVDVSTPVVTPTPVSVPVATTPVVPTEASTVDVTPVTKYIFQPSLIYNWIKNLFN